MFYEKNVCKKENEQLQNLRHRVTGDCSATNVRKHYKSVQNNGKERFIEKADSRTHRSAVSSISENSARSINSVDQSTSISSQTKQSQRSSRKYSERQSRSGDSSQRRAKCHDVPAKRKTEPCSTTYAWQRNNYEKDECGSGIAHHQSGSKPNQKNWCTTPLSMYQSTIGEFARKVLCNELKMTKNVNPAPPCNVCEYTQPPCRGYYRKYDCIRNGEEEFVNYKNGKKMYRDRVQRYWQPNFGEEEKLAKDVRHYAPHNSYLGEQIRRKFQDSTPCW